MIFRFTPTSSPQLPEASWDRLPKWRGFNLLEKFSLHRTGPFCEDDFRTIASLGFNFVRLPMDYRVWIRKADPRRIDPKAFTDIDDAVRWGIRYGVHVNLNLHRAPGYCINPPAEPADLWTDKPTQKICAKHWGFLSRRYRRVPNSQLSFNLFNEPSGAINREDYVRVVGLMCREIRRHHRDRLIIVDGLDCGRIPLPELLPLRVAQSGRGYDPFIISHYRAPWVPGAEEMPEPSWPVPPERADSGAFPHDAKGLREKYQPWKNLERAGAGVMIGEWGAFNRTPPAVRLRWMEDCLKIWQENGWGWALWNFRGPFGPAENGRAGSRTELRDGLSFETEMLELIRRY